MKFRAIVKQDNKFYFTEINYNGFCQALHLSSLHNSLVGVTKIENIVPRAGIEPMSLAFRSSVLIINTS